MAIAFVADRANLNSNTGATTFDLVLASLTVGNTLIIRVAADNAGASGAASTLTVTNQSGTAIDTATDTLNTQNNDPGAASAGVTCHVIIATITATSGTVRLTFGNTVVAAMQAEEWSGIHSATPRNPSNAAVGANGTASTNLASCATGKVVNYGRMAYAAMAIEGPAADTITEDADTAMGTWTSLTKRGTTNATADLNMTIAGAYKLPTAASPVLQTYNPTNSVARDSAGIIFDLIPKWTGDPVKDIGWNVCFWVEGTRFTALGLSDGAALTTWPAETNSAGTDDVTQAVAGAKPTYRATGGLGNRKNVQADGGDLLLNATVPNTNQPLTLFAVAESDDTDTNTRTVYSGGTSSDPKIETIAGVWAINAGDPALSSATTDDANWHSFLGYFESSTVGVMRLDNAQIASGDPGAGNATVGTAIFDKASPGEAWIGRGYFFGTYPGDLRAHPNYANLESWAADLKKVTATMAAPLGALSATATAVPKKVVTMAAPLGSLTAAMTATVIPGAPTVSATMAAPLGVLTATATATPKKVVTMAAPLGALSATAAATPIHPATMAAPLGSLTATATATPIHPATLAAPLGSLTATMAAHLYWPATMAAPLGSLTATATASRKLAATMAAPLGLSGRELELGDNRLLEDGGFRLTEEDAVLTATMGATPRHPVTMAAPLGVLTASMSAKVTHLVTMAAPLGGLSATVTATPKVLVTMAAPLGSLSATATAVPKKVVTMAAPLGSLVATATAVVRVPATAVAPLGALTASITATPKHPATMAAPLGALTAAATAAPVKLATMAAPLGGLTASMTATATTPSSPVLAAPLGGLVATATATVRVPATMSAPLGGLTATATATVKVPVTMAAPLGGLSASAAAKVKHAAILSAPLGGLAATATAKVKRFAALAAPLGALSATAAAKVRHPATMSAPLGGLVATAAATPTELAVMAADLGPLMAVMTATPMTPTVPPLDLKIGSLDIIGAYVGSTPVIKIVHAGHEWLP